MADLTAARSVPGVEDLAETPEDPPHAVASNPRARTIDPANQILGEAKWLVVMNRH
jgi:hypothetical protein